MMKMILQDIPLGKNIKSRRIELGFTQAQVVEKMQLKGSMISRRTYSHIESENRNIKASDLKILAEFLRISLDSLFGKNL